MVSISTRGVRRRVATALLAGAVSVLSIGSVASAADDRFDITGTIYDVEYDNGATIATIVTSDLIGKPQPIMVDVSQIKDVDFTRGTSIQLSIYSREDDTFLAREVVREYPYVNGADFGVEEWMTTRQDSIQAGVGNVPEDDEALNKQHRSPQNLREREDDDDDDNKKNNR